MVTLFVTVMVVLFFPIFSEGYFYFDTKTKKPVFLIKIFGLKLLGGYIRTGNGFVFFHYGEKKAFAFKTANAKNMKLKPKHLQGIKINRLCLAVGTDISDVGISAVTLGSFFARSFYVLTENLSPVKTFRTDFELRESDKTEIFFNLGIVFNLAIITAVFIKYLVGNLCNQTKKKKK